MATNIQIEGKPVRFAGEVSGQLLKDLYAMEMEGEAIGGGVLISLLEANSKVDFETVDQCLLFLMRMFDDGLVDRARSRRSTRSERSLNLLDTIRLTPAGIREAERLLGGRRGSHLKELYSITIESFVAGVIRGVLPG